MRLEVVLPFVAAGVLLMVLAVPLIKRRVRPNPIYGLRVPATYADEWVWYEANARSGRDLFVLGALITVASLVLSATGAFSDQAFAMIFGLAIAAGAVFCAVIGWRRANRLLREKRLGSGGPTS